MAVLESSMENKELQKQSPKHNKNALLLSQDLNYAKNLAANDGKVRRRSLKYLKKYLEQRSKANALTEGSLKILWKGLFYSMWMSDKPLVQEECAENISNLIHCLQFEDAMHFFKIGMITLQNEWIGIDQLRLDKFLMFVRRLLRQAFFVLKNTNFKKQPNEVFAKILEETILSTEESVSLGLVMHFTEIYLEELAKVADGILQSSRTIDFLRPYITKLAFDRDNRITQWINKFIFTHLMKQHKLGLEYENKYKIWKAQEFVGSINQIQKIIIADDEAEEQDSDNESKTTTQYKPLDPRAGKVDVELPQILFNAKEISEALLVPKIDPRTSKNTRIHLTIWSSKFLQLHNGIYPIGIRKLVSKKSKNDDRIDTNITKAAKRLIKFEQELLAKDCKGIKRKRDNLESQDQGFDAPNLKKKAKKTIAKTNSTQDIDKVKQKKEKMLKRKSNYLLVDPEDTKSKKVSKKNEALKTNKNKAVLTNKLRKTKPNTGDSSSAIGSSNDDYNFCFERNSGMWFVTPEISENNETAKQKPVKEKKIVNENTNNYEILTPSKKFANKKPRIDKDTEDVLSMLRGKSLVDAEEEEQRPPRTQHVALNAFDLDDVKFIKKFRLSKELTQTLIDMVSPFLQAPTRASAISIELKVLTTLRFYATGSYQEIVGCNLFAAISQPSTSRCITEVTDALNQQAILDEWIKFPQNIQEMENLRRRFYEKYAFPGVIGLIDCTHVAIIAPSSQEYPENVYVNRKNYHSINVQLVCDENLRILNVDSRFPGSCHDSHIWKQSRISEIMEQVHRRNPNNLLYLLGDSGYTLRPWLLTPLDTAPNTAQEELFDSRLKTIRSGIERCNGVLKNRFRCLLKHRVLHYTPNRASKIINGCCVLHNMCVQSNVPEPDMDDIVDDLDFGIYYDQLVEDRPHNVVNPDLAFARRLQRHIAANYFN